MLGAYEARVCHFFHCFDFHSSFPVHLLTSNCPLAAEQLGRVSDGGQKLEVVCFSFFTFHLLVSRCPTTSVSLTNYTCVIGKLYVCRWATHRGVYAITPSFDFFECISSYTTFTPTFTASSPDEQGKSERSVCGERKNKNFFSHKLEKSVFIISSKLFLLFSLPASCLFAILQSIP